MAAADAKSFSEYGQAERVYGTFRLVTTLKEASGTLTALAALVSKDGGAYASCTNSPVQQGTTGMVYVELTATEKTANHVQVKFTSTLANTEDVIVPIKPLMWSSVAGRGTSRFEELIRKVAEYMLNEVNDTGSNIEVLCDDSSTVSLSGGISEGENSATRNKLT